MHNENALVERNKAKLPRILMAFEGGLLYSRPLPFLPAFTSL